MSKTIAMIPVRLGSKRVKNKNLRLIDGKPLISYVLETTIKSNIFDEIYINSESDIFEPIAKKYGVFRKLLELLEFIVGIKNPDCLFTVGSGWKNFGKYNIGISYTFKKAFS